MKIIKLYGSEDDVSSDKSIPSWFEKDPNVLDTGSNEKEHIYEEYTLPIRSGILAEHWEDRGPRIRGSESSAEKSDDLSEEPVRFRSSLTSPQNREDCIDSTNLELASPPQPKRKVDCLETTVNFVLDYWRILVLALVGLVILLVVIFIVVFFVAIKPGAAGTTVGPVIATTLPTSTVTRSTKYTTVTQSITTAERKTTMKGTDPAKTSSKICTDGFDLYNDKCYRLFTDPDTQFNADTRCVRYSGAVLATAKTAQDNRNLQNYINEHHVDQVWLGLKCQGNDDFWCQWDHDQGHIEGYSNFAEGYPNWFYGNCTYMDRDGFWINEDCELVQLPYVCELPTTTEDTCDHNYNNFCYLRQDYYQTFQEGIDICKQLCATMVSIHSELENLFVKSIYPDVNGYFIFWLGGMAANMNYVVWSDRTPNNYQSNYSQFSYNWGCLNMNYRTGEWYTQSCKLNRWFICKRKTGVWC